jgi:outer membrane protein OmpA-like peptidoglycan-associated protein
MSRRTSFWLAGLASLAVATVPSRAFAQDALPGGTGFDLHLFRHAVDSKGQFTVNGSDILGHLQPSFGLVVDWGRGLARRGTLAPTMGMMSQGTNDVPLVENMFSGVFHANLGIANFMVVGLQLPVHLVSGPGTAGDGAISPLGGHTPTDNGLNFQGFGTLTLHAKFRFMRVERTNFGLGLVVQAGIPLQSGPSNYAGDPGVMLWPSVIAEWRPHRVFRMDLNVGYRMGLGAAGRIVDTTWANPLTYGLGLSVRVAPALDLVAEVYGGTYTNNFFQPRSTPMEAIGGLKIFVVSNSYLMLGAGRRILDADAAADIRAFVGFVFEPSIGDRDGDGLRDDEDRCPDQPEDFDHFEDSDGCPEPDNDQDGVLDVDDQCPLTPEDRDGEADDDGCPDRDNNDRDGDGILDAVDQCPDQPEDRDDFQDEDGCPDPDNDQDGILDREDICPNNPEDRDDFEDQDGCPDPDNDHDRIPDVRDRCVMQPETYNGTEDEDGCPDQGIAVLEENNIRILQAINFETDSAQIRPESLTIVEAVAATLRGNPQIALVQVQGHADERGDDDHNLQLTRDRAASVVRALVERGVERNRLQSAGYGERCPIDPRPRNPEAWARNRRVIFLILRTQTGPTNVPIACEAGHDLIPDEHENRE